MMKEKPKRRSFLRRKERRAGPGRFSTSPPYLFRFFPNMVTLTALCMGLSSVSFGFQHNWPLAVASVLIAGVLDGIDGPLARLLHSSTDFGAELDSLADFINFGVAPALLSYFFALHQWGRFGWCICLFFAACSALRLARFNIQRVDPHQVPRPSYFSIGVPVTISSLLAFMPMIYSFIFNEVIVAFHALMLFMTGLFMISRFPTFVAKGIRIRPEYIGLVGCLSVFLIVVLLAFPWETLLLLSGLYLFSLPVSFWIFYKTTRNP